MFVVFHEQFNHPIGIYTDQAKMMKAIHQNCKSNPPFEDSQYELLVDDRRHINGEFLIDVVWKDGDEIESTDTFTAYNTVDYVNDNLKWG